MPDYIADSEGRIDVPGVEATYPPGTIVTYVNGAYAGHVSPVLEEPPAETPLQGGSVGSETLTQPIPAIQEPLEHPSTQETDQVV